MLTKGNTPITISSDDDTNLNSEVQNGFCTRFFFREVFFRNERLKKFKIQQITQNFETSSA